MVSPTGNKFHPNPAGVGMRQANSRREVELCKHCETELISVLTRTSLERQREEAEQRLKDAMRSSSSMQAIVPALAMPPRTAVSK